MIDLTHLTSDSALLALTLLGFGIPVLLGLGLGLGQRLRQWRARAGATPGDPATQAYLDAARELARTDIPWSRDREWQIMELLMGRYGLSEERAAMTIHTVLHDTRAARTGAERPPSFF